MSVEISVVGAVKEKEEKLLVFCDVEYKIFPSFAARVARRLQCRPAEDSSTLILRGACGALRPGRLTFLLGPSGAGKSSVLGVLTGRRQRGVEGRVIGGHGAVLVTQHASLLPALTTREVLHFAAVLRLPNSTKTERDSAVTRVARQLGLENGLATRTPRLSGGERKRLTAACELLTDPPVLLLDEPTSGLDSVSSLSVVRALSSVARGGRIVACVVHQPSSRLYSVADDVILMSDGRTLYAGAREDAPAVLLRAGFVCPQFYNPADFLLEVASGEHTGNLNQLETDARNYAYELQKAALENHKEGPDIGVRRSHSKDGTDHKKETSKQPPYAASSCLQLRALLWRCGVCGIRDFHLSQLRFCTHFVVALMLGALYAGSGSDGGRVTTNASCLFFFMLFLFFVNAMPTINTFPREAEVVLQEHLNYWYSLRVYWISKLIAELPMQICCATVFVIPAWYLTDQPTEEMWRLAYMWLVCVLLTVLAQTFGLVIGAAFNVQAGLFIVPAANIPMLMFSGFFITYEEMPSVLRPFAYMSYFRYSFDAALQCVYGYGRESLQCKKAFCFYRIPQKFLEDMAMPNDYWGSVTGMVVWILLVQVALMAVLVIRVRIACR